MAGTSAELVVIDYLNRLVNATSAVEPLLVDAAKAMGQQNLSSTPELTLNGDVLEELTSGDYVAVQVFNSLSWELVKFVETPCYHTHVVVTDASGNVVPSDVLPALNTTLGPCLVPGTCGHRNSTSPYTLFFEATVPALGFATFFVSLASSQDGEAYRVSEAEHTVSNGVMSLSFDPETKLLSSIENAPLLRSAQISQNFYQYTEPDTNDGAQYQFHANGPATPLVKGPYSYKVFSGKFVTEVHQRFTPSCELATVYNITCGVRQVHRIFQSSNDVVANTIEVLTDAGPLAYNVDIVSRYSTELQSNLEFYTDNNCVDTRHRVYNASMPSPLEGNFFPISCQGFIQDMNADVQLTFLVDRTHGATSQAQGEFEIVYHRRASIGLDDIDNLQNIRSIMLFSNISTSTLLRRQLQYQLQFPPTLFYSVAAGQPSNWPFATNNSALLQPLPLNVHVLSLLQLNSTVDLVLRLVHIYELGDDPVLSQPVSLQLSQYFAFASISSMDERTLTTILPVSALDDRMTRFTGKKKAGQERVAPTQENGFLVTLTPTAIRTFFVGFQ